MFSATPSWDSKQIHNTIMMFIFKERIIFLVSIILALSSTINTCAQESGVDLFIKACQNSGWNPNLISSVRLEFEAKEWDAVYAIPSSYTSEMLEQMLPMYDGDPKARDESLRLAEEARKKRAVEGFSYSSSVIFRTMNSETFFRMLSTQATLEGERRFVFRGLQHKIDEDLAASVFWGYDSNTLSVNKKMPFNAPRVQLWGRAQGKYVTLALASLTGNLDYVRFVFPPDTVAQFKQVVQQNPQAFVLVGEEQYDGNSAAKVVEVKVNDKLLQRYWIDPSRGYVCPRIEVYDDKTWNIIDEYCSSGYFLDVKTGLWFPENYEHKKSNPKDASMVHRRVYKLNRLSFVLNEKIADEAFSLDIPERTYIQDERVSPHRNYESIDTGTVSLKEGGLDLDKMNWLQNVEYPLENVATENRFLRLRVFFSILGAILILIALYRMWRQNIGKSQITSLTLVFLFLSGCAPGGVDVPVNSELNVAAVSDLRVQPSTLDFGRARHIDSPIELVFDVVNDSEKAIMITAIDSGCGCTVIDIPSDPIPPKGKVSIPLKVNLLGQRGDFKSMVRIRTDASQDVFVNLQGNIVADIWYDGQILRCSAEAQQQKVTTVLNIFTADHHDIVFDFDNQEEGVNVTEKQRIRKNGETQISLSVSLEIGDSESIFRNVWVVSKDKSVLPLLVPITCIRRETEWMIPTLTTSQVSLGQIQSGVSASARIYGDPDIIVAICDISLRELTNNILLAAEICGELQGDATGTFLEISFFADPLSPHGTFEGKVFLKSLGNREYVIPLYGSLNQ